MVIREQLQQGAAPEPRQEPDGMVANDVAHDLLPIRPVRGSDPR